MNVYYSKNYNKLNIIIIEGFHEEGINTSTYCIYKLAMF